jgi:hypothetical protein
MIGLYKGFIFKGQNKFWTFHIVDFLGEWEDTDEEFLKTYHKLYPNEKLQIYLNKFRPLSRKFKVSIEKYIEIDPYFIKLKRDEILKGLLF